MAFDGHYLDWNQKRVKGIVDFYGYKFMQGKKILDLGCGHADISGVLHRLGADVTAIDSRSDHLKIVNKKFSGIKTLQADLDRGWPLPNQRFDMILDLGVLCHLANFEEHLRTVCANTKYLVLETAIADTDDPNFCSPVGESKGVYDLSANGLGCRPSAAAVEKVLTDCGMNFQRLDDAKFNTPQYVYDWKVTGSKNLDLHKRRIWFASKANMDAQAPRKTAMTLMAQPIGNSLPILAPLPNNLVLPIVQPPVVPVAPVAPPSTPSKSVRVGPQPANSNGIPKTRLFYNYYADPNSSRQAEIDLCLQKNIENNNFDIVILDCQNKPTFNFFFQKINQLVGPNDISIICNADIFFDKSISLISKIGLREIYAISRLEWHKSNNVSAPGATDAQNAWVIRGPITNVNGDFLMGAPGSAGRIAYEFQKAGYRVVNPCRSVKTYHAHDSGVRNYSESDKVPGPYLSVELTSL